MAFGAKQHFCDFQRSTLIRLVAKHTYQVNAFRT
jgi:hypothetical protein